MIVLMTYENPYITKYIHAGRCYLNRFLLVKSKFSMAIKEWFVFNYFLLFHSIINIQKNMAFALAANEEGAVENLEGKNVWMQPEKKPSRRRKLKAFLITIAAILVNATINLRNAFVSFIYAFYSALNIM